MLLKDIACVLADTARSKAYIQALAQHDLRPSRCLVLSEGAGTARQLPEEWNARKYFNLEEPLLTTLETHGIAYEVIASKDINSSEAEAAVRELPQCHLIYSGYGGAILKPHLFQLGKKWIHVHAGLLPSYRGSTTAYYSLLDNGKLGATAIFLNEQIDEGSIITAEEFPPPERGELVDYVYEPYIRSQVLVKAVQSYVQKGRFEEVPQSLQGGETYFIIHPVLKHIAILELNQHEQQE